MAARVKRLALFGGSFSPPHNGHVEAALSFLQFSQADELIIMPSGIHPCKELSGEVSDAHRLEMCRLAFERDARFGGKCRVSDMEIAKGGVSYTCDTLRRLKNEANEIYMLVGADVLCGMEKWKSIGEVLSAAVICCARRGDISADRAAERLREKYGARILFTDGEILPVSSFNVRKALENGASVRSLVPRAVEDYITENSLYGVRNDR